MKYRKDFVTNSSSSSFICEICGNSESGWDMGLSEAGMCSCVNGHIFCESHLLDRSNKSTLVRYIMQNGLRKGKTEAELFDIDEGELWDEYITECGCYEIPEDFCPICQFIEYSEKDMVSYLLKEYKVSKEEVFEIVKKVNKRRKKLYDGEYIAEVCKRFNLSPIVVSSEWKNRFGSYLEFNNYITKNN